MPYTYNLEISGMKFHITNIYSYAYRYCQQYLIDIEGDHIIETTQDDIDNERQMAKEMESDYEPDMSNAPDYYLESIALLRKLADYICDYNRILMHGSAIAINGKGYIFTALSGTGKSTQAEYWKQMRGAEIINGDRVLITKRNGKFFANGIYVAGTSGTASVGDAFFAYKLTDNTGRLLVLRPDNTTPIARVVSTKLKNSVEYDIGCIFVFFASAVFKHKLCVLYGFAEY